MSKNIFILNGCNVMSASDVSLTGPLSSVELAEKYIEDQIAASVKKYGHGMGWEDHCIVEPEKPE